MRSASSIIIAITYGLAVCSGERVNVKIGSVTIGEKEVQEGATADGLVFTERQRINVGVSITANGKAVESIEQAALRFTHQSGKQVWFPLESLKSESWAANIDLIRHAEQSFFFTAGKYALALVISDPSFKQQTERELGTVTMDFTATPLFKQRMEFSEMKDWVRRAPQTWDMKPADDRGSAGASLAFSAAFSVPVLILFAMLYSAGINVKGLFSNPATFLRSVVFQGCMCGICVVTVLYWISLPLFPALITIGGLGAVAFVFRPKAAEEKAKKE
eukprot:TRINITY_DN5056_c0_g1_i1.p1 TRINITY_DN5056_c0_g1~~TRINITY_DN5056_c0_g1_i1.p1  ORF type:complete len:275 (+),score=61.47 TRINITY_DN5056_c0_g1_i1:60-884(+)